MSSDFLADNNLCGQNLLKIVASGNGILAQLCRLSSVENIPQVFRLENKNDQHKYQDIILDLRYFTESELFEKKIEQNSVLRDLDNALRDSYTKVLTEFYLLFESIFRYVTELNKFVQEVNDGFYIQTTLENILTTGEGRQLLAESLYLYGCMLLLLDYYIDGTVRERMVTSFYRYTGRTGGVEHSDVHVDDICKLIRTTKRSPSYPQDYFQRIEIDRTFVQLLLGRLRSDDIYNQLSSYPLPDHRTAALGPQSSILVVILFFSPHTLHNENSTMREISDKFFHDNWIVPIYIGYTINLIDAWDGFKAAKMALELSTGINSTDYTARTIQWPKLKMQQLSKEVAKLLKEGVIVEDNILEKSSQIITLLRECNVKLRWTILHTAIPFAKRDGTFTKKSKMVRDTVVGPEGYDQEVTLTLLLNVSQLELKVRELFRKLLQEKQAKWTSLKLEAAERVRELAEVFSGNKPLTRIEKNEKLSKWLETKASQIEALDYGHLTSSGRRIAELIPAFNEMLEFHNLETQVQVREWVNETTGCLLSMLRTGSVNEDTLVTLQIVGDLSYAWGPLIDIYTAQMQKLIQKDPFAVSKLRAVFLKLASAMDMPLLRLSQSKSNELVPVSSYYSGELVSYVQKVLQIIPESIFRLLHEIIEIQTNSIQELPTRLDKEKLKEFVQLEQRGKISRLTHDMSILTEGIQMMQSTLVGIICIDPRLLLELGIRKELIRQLVQTLNYGSGKLSSKLEFIAQRISGIQRSFEYIGDYLSTQGLIIFQSEFARLINFATEQECNRWTNVKILPLHSVWQSKDVPISFSSITVLPQSSSPEESAGFTTFVGKIAHELISLTDSKVAICLRSTCSWYDIKSHAEVASPELFKALERAVDIVGLIGIDKVISFIIVKELEKLVKILTMDLHANRELLTSIHSNLDPPTKLVQPIKNYQTWSGKVISQQSSKTVPVLLMKIGHLQLLRKRIQYQLKVSSNLNSKQLYSAVEVMNRLMSFGLQDQLPEFEEPSIDIVNCSEPLGIYEPLTKIYIQNFQRQGQQDSILNLLSSSNNNNLALYLTLITIQQTKKLIFDKNISTLVSRKTSEPIDSFSLITGLTTLLMQMHPNIGVTPYLTLLCQHLNSLFISYGSSPSAMTTASSAIAKDDDFGSIYIFIKQFVTNYPASKNDLHSLVKVIVPCFDMMSTFC